MKLPKTILCDLPGDERVCHVDEEGMGSCGDGVIFENGQLCLWTKEVLEWYPGHLSWQDGWAVRNSR